MNSRVLGVWRMQKPYRLLIGVTVLLALVLSTQTFAQSPQTLWQTTLTIAVGDEPQTFDPHVNVAAVSGRRFFPSIYESLLRYGVDGSLQPQLATSWNVSPDGLRYTFQLRPGVKFSDGTPFTAAAVKWNLDRLFKLGRGPVGLFEPIREIIPQGDHTIVFLMKRPYAPFLRLMAAWQGAVFVSPAYVQANERTGDSGTAHMHNHTAGTGPYVLESWAPDNQIVLVKNNHYRERWGAQSITRVIYRNIKEPSTAMQMLLRGDVDILEELTQPDFIDVMARVSTIQVQIEESIGGNNIHLWGNLKKPPFDNVRVRQAIAAAVDYDRIVSNVFPKVGRPARGMFAESAKPWFDSSIKPRKRDLAAAQRLMRESGVQLPSPFPVELSWQSGFRAQREMAQIIKENLAGLGFDVQIVEQPLPVWREAIWRNTFQLTFVQLGLRFPDPDAVVHLVFHSSNFRHGGFNPGYVNPRMDELIEQGRALTNQADRVKVYQEIQRLVERDAVTTPIVFFGFVYTYRVGISGITWNPNYGVQFEPFTITKDPSTYRGR